MFVGASQNTSLVISVWADIVYLQQLTYSKKTVMADRCFSLRPVSMLTGQRASKMGGTFSLQ